MPNSYGTEPDRGEAVNLARTVLSQPSDPEITNKGIVKLAQTVLAMDDWILAHTNGPIALDTARLDLMEKNEVYPWPDYGCWKFRHNGKLFEGKTARDALDAALSYSATATSEGHD